MDNLKPVFIREELIKITRSFFFRKKFHEVIVPVLNKTVPLEPNLFPFSTKWNTVNNSQKLYLSMSPERGLKRMLAKGIDNCFAIGKSFRNLENSGTQHIPEFLMLEWYRKNASYHDIIKDTQKLIHVIDKSLSLLFKEISHINNKWSTLTLSKLFLDFTGLDLIKLIENNKLIFSYAEKKGYQILSSSWNELYDQIFVNEIEPNLPNNPCFIIDFPSQISPLCKPKKDNPQLAERFELYINRTEIANGNTENTDIESINNIFIKEKNKVGKDSQPIDYDFLKALEEMKKSSYAGIGLGIDRLAMIFSNSDNISSVEPLLF